jgi:hypothetical protein
MVVSTGLNSHPALPIPLKISHKPPLEVGLWTWTLLDDIPAVAFDPGNH